MITRFVKMTFHKQFAEKFEEVFETRQHLISAFPGCRKVELLKERNIESQTTVYFTQSLWDDEKDLELYRKSDLFLETWKITKPLFASKADAWTLEIV